MRYDLSSRRKYNRIPENRLYFLVPVTALFFGNLPLHAQGETDLIPGEERPGIIIEPLENDPLAAPNTIPGSLSPDGEPTSGDEGTGGNFSLSSPGGVLYDMARGLALAQGNVDFTYREFRVRGDRGVIDYNKNVATLTGNLTITVRGREFKGKTLNFNLDTGEWTVNQVETTFPPDFFPPGTVLEPIYVTNGTVTGVDDNATGNDFRFSSCDRDHYYIQSKRIDFFRDPNGDPERIVLKKNALYAFGKKILPLPVYVIALAGARSRRVGLQPIVGQNATDGFFVKTVYDLAANEKKTDSLLIDALQKRGLGLGFQRELARGAGLFYLYALSGQTGGREIDSRIRRRWQVTDALSSIVNFQSTSNNSFGGQGTSSQNGDLAFNYNTPSVNSDLFLRYSNSKSQFGSFGNIGSTFQHRQDFGSGWSIDANSLYAGSRSAGTVDSSTLDNTMIVSNRARLFDTFLRAELHDDLTGRNQVNGAYSLERLPEIGLTTDSERLGLPLLNDYLPGDVTLGFGTFNEPSSLNRLSRTSFDYRLRPQDFKLLKAGPLESNLNVGGRFEQSFYSNDTARYNYDYNFGLENKLGPLTSTVNYFKGRTLGYTPFQFDFFSPSEYVDTTLSYQPSEKFRLNLSSGRDLQSGYTRDVDARLQWAPSRSFYASLGAAYSPENRTFGDVVGNFRLARNPQKLLGGTLDLGIRYSPSNNSLSRVNATLDLFASRKTRVQALTGYNGISREFDFNQIRVTRDLHCFNLFATYDSTRKELRFDLALKAFPFVDTRYGVGQFGEGFGSQIGD
ncbi:MAG TPA: hypothetical protein VF719_00500, partial [Abditibacteriaceae bacterium]